MVSTRICTRGVRQKDLCADRVPCILLPHHNLNARFCADCFIIHLFQFNLVVLPTLSPFGASLRTHAFCSISRAYLTVQLRQIPLRTNRMHRLACTHSFSCLLRVGSQFAEIATLGMECMKKLVKMRVLIVGLRGVGMETAKNIILAGVKEVVLHDPTPATAKDMGLNFYITEQHVKEGARRDEASLGELDTLNEYVPVSVLAGADGKPAVGLDDETIKAFDCLVLCDDAVPSTRLEALDELCRNTRRPSSDEEEDGRIGFLSCSLNGAAGRMFLDFGPGFEVLNADGKPPVQHIVKSITKETQVKKRDADGNPTETLKRVRVWMDLKEDDQMAIDDGMHVYFKGCQSIPSLNATVDDKDKPSKTFEVSNAMKGAGYFEFDHDWEASGMPDFAPLGTCEVFEFKKPQPRAMVSFAEKRKEPGFMDTPYFGVDFMRPSKLHAAFEACDAFAAAHDGAAPRTNSAEDAADVRARARDLAKADGMLDEATFAEGEADDKLVGDVVRCSGVQLQSMAAVFGGIIAQEIVKLTGQFRPVEQQLLYIADPFIAAAGSDGDAPADYAPRGDRYDDLRAVIGDANVAKLAKSKIFMVGSGALGCELLKNFALSGMGLKSAGGMCTVTDADDVERSNLNRQFLFRAPDVKKPKSTQACARAQLMNPDFQTVSHTVFASPSTENIFSDDFWDALDLVIPALDTIKARKYVDGKCAWHRVAEFESGTEGLKCHASSMVPCKTPCWNDGEAGGEGGGGPAEHSCTVKQYPYKSEHCVVHAKFNFDDQFEGGVKLAQDFTRDAAGARKTWAEDTPSGAKGKIIKTLLVARPAVKGTFQSCVESAAHMFLEQCYAPIQDLANSYPEDAKQQDGTPFWTGTKRFPSIEPLNVRGNELHRAFIYHAACLFAQVCGIKEGVPAEGDVDALAKMVDAAQAGGEVPAYKPKKMVPKSGGGEDSKEEDLVPDPGAAQEEFDSVLALFDKIVGADGSSYAAKADSLEGQHFEKDDDTNHHVDFLTAFTNVRCASYKIDLEERLQVKVMAGHIIPAVATTTGMVAGFVTNESIKYCMGYRDVKYFQPPTCDLSADSFAFEEPNGPKRHEGEYDDATMGTTVRAHPNGWTSWDFLEVDGNDKMTCMELCELLNKKHGMVVSDLVAIDKLMFNEYAAKKYKDSPVVEAWKELVGPIGEGTHALRIGVSAETEDFDTTLSLPDIKFFLGAKGKRNGDPEPIKADDAAEGAAAGGGGD